MTSVNIILWGRRIAAVSWSEERKLAYFEYDPEFINSQIQVAPLMMPLSSQIYSFPALAKKTFNGLPGMLSDSLPDKFGNALIDQWLIRQGRSIESFNPVDRLAYIGNRGIGALEFSPSPGPNTTNSNPLNIEALVELANEVVKKRSKLKVSFKSKEKEKAMQDILQIGTSAGGARAKAIIAWNRKTNEVCSGQANHKEGFSYWLLKFDGISNNKDKGLEDPQSYGLIEYAYYKMCRASGINMNESTILSENGRNHFITKRFDRNQHGHKLHMQSLAGLAHYDFNQAGAYSYEQVFNIIRKLDLGMESLEEQFRRMVFNIVARNQDDHVKNISFSMDKKGKWQLSPAYDMVYSYNPEGLWTNTHQLSLNAKRDDFTLDDFIACEKRISLKKGRAKQILEEVMETVSQWESFAKEAGLDKKLIKEIGKSHRLSF
jgi:serine/threonine-protein kinase HipA